MKRSSSSYDLVLLAIIVWCFLLPCSASRAKGAGFNFPTGVRGEGIRPKSPKPGAPRAQNCPGCGHDYARPPPALTAPRPSKQQNCPGCGNAYTPPPSSSGTAVSAPRPPNQQNCPGCGYEDALAPPVGATRAAPGPHHCPRCDHAYAVALAAPQRKNLPGTRY
ncbi:hypothetical protein VPH35_051941 [Triticum aestivum]